VSGVFITLEGGEGLGKSVQAAKLAEHLRTGGRDVVLTREPGGTPFGERIRDVLLHTEGVRIVPKAQALLFSAARAAHVLEVIRPALRRGAIVIADRFYDSTHAYQGHVYGVDLEELRALTRFAVGDLVPDRTFLIDAPVDVVTKRLAARGGGRWDRFHVADPAFHELVRQAYLRLAADEPERFTVVNGAQSEESVAADIRRQVDELLGQPA
jgi:dTMP kinase